MTGSLWVSPKNPLPLDTPTPFYDDNLCFTNTSQAADVSSDPSEEHSRVTATTAARSGVSLSSTLIRLSAVLPHQIRVLLEAVGL